MNYYLVTYEMYRDDSEGRRGSLVVGWPSGYDLLRFNKVAEAEIERQTGATYFHIVLTGAYKL